MDYQIIVFDKKTGLASVQIPAVPKKLTGVDKLVQIVILSFLRNPGKSVLFPVEGSGLRGEIGQFNFSGDGAEVRALAIQRVRVVQQEVIGRQNPNQGTPEERLKSLVLKDFAFDAAASKAVLKVQIINEAGDTRNVLV